MFTCSIVIEHEFTGGLVQALLKVIKLKIPPLRFHFKLIPVLHQYRTDLRIPVYRPTLHSTIKLFADDIVLYKEIIVLTD